MLFFVIIRTPVRGMEGLFVAYLAENEASYFKREIRFYRMVFMRMLSFTRAMARMEEMGKSLGWWWEL